ncbi:pickpocket protein 28-like isoform X1 [Choristoneura fumiferana]|uniref:pickpocket protein 28-like isoform X1 n=1 Tax=Choristoneura fumiferana TaxID=7141 RepID=UPI003D15EFA0
MMTKMMLKMYLKSSRRSCSISKERVGIRRRLRRERRRLVAGELMQDFAQNTTLHGLRYIAERRLSFTEKLFWIVAFVISLSMCVLLIWNVWVKWRTSPVIVTLSEQLVSVGEVPFPSITICPQLKLKRSAYSDNIFFEVLNLTSKSNWTEDEIKILQKHEDLSNLCFHQVNYRRNYSDTKIIEHYFEVSPTAQDVLQSCQWREAVVPCVELFQPVLTLEGVCFTMNSLAASEIFRLENIQNNYSYIMTLNASKGWSHSDGYLSSDNDVYPKRGRSNGIHPDLTVFLKEDPLEWSNNCITTTADINCTCIIQLMCRSTRSTTSQHIMIKLSRLLSL